MINNQFEILANKGIVIKGQKWQSKGACRALLCLVHGLGEHIGRYDHLARFMNKNNITVYGLDLRGHGKTSGKRGHASYLNLLDDIGRLVEKARSEHPGLPLFLFGHSLGGNIVANYILKRNTTGLSGAIINSPWFKLGFEPPKSKVLLGKLMHKIYPAFTENNSLDTSQLSKDPHVEKAYLNDPMVHPKISAGLFVGAYEAGLWALDNAHMLKVPALIMHGSEDTLTSPEGSREFAQRAGNKIEFKLWKGLMHETHNEIEKEKVLKYMKDWMVRQIEVRRET